MCVYLEPIALYNTRDLYDDGDRLWLAPPSSDDVALGSARTYGEGNDLTIVTWANGLRMSLRAARALEAAGVRARVVDLRWLAPLPVEDLLREANATGRVLVVDETRRTGGVSEGIIAALVDAKFDGQVARVASADSFIPLGDAANLVLVSEQDVERGGVGARRGARLIRAILAVLVVVRARARGGGDLVVGRDARAGQRGAREGRGAAARRLARLGEGVRAGRAADSRCRSAAAGCCRGRS